MTKADNSIYRPSFYKAFTLFIIILILLQLLSFLVVLVLKKIPLQDYIAFGMENESMMRNIIMYGLFYLILGVLFGGSQWFMSVKFEPDGIKGFDLLYRKQYLKWADNLAVSKVNLLGFKYLRLLHSEKGITLWIPLFFYNTKPLEKIISDHLDY